MYSIIPERIKGIFRHCNQLAIMFNNIAADSLSSLSKACMRLLIPRITLPPNNVTGSHSGTHSVLMATVGGISFAKCSTGGELCPGAHNAFVDRQGISSQFYPFILHQAFQHQRLLPWNNKKMTFSSPHSISLRFLQSVHSA